MSPVAQSRGHAGRALAVSAVAVGVLIAVAAGIAMLASRGEVDVKLGDEVFSGQDVDRLAAEIEDRGPILYADTAGGSRDIVVTHLGDDPQSGWYAFAARPPGVSRECTVQSRDRDGPLRLLGPDREVTGECDGREFPPDGEGLPQYPATVRDGKLDIDLNAADRATSTTA
ncbi:MAG TPA: hypothetical protein VFB77_15030 [Acidimicrobiales bacterium]|nr:hypothetical protein [Acidimicrobiales bacterium]